MAERVGGLSREQQLRRRVEDALRDLGFDQIVGWSFTDPGEPARLRIPEGDPRAEPIVLANPLSEDQSAMRTTLLGSLLDVAARNTARGAERLALFEAARVYLRWTAVGEAARWPATSRASGRRPSPSRTGLAPCGRAAGRGSWRGGGEPADFFALKGVLEALAGQLGVELSFAPATEPFLHPGRAAAVSIAGRAGWIGEVHPLVCREWDLEAAVGFELDHGPLVGARRSARSSTKTSPPSPPPTRTWPWSSRPSPRSEVREAVLVGGGELLHSADVFDLYEGEQLGEARKSLALRLVPRPDRTLTDTEVGGLRDSIEAKLEEIGGILREWHPPQPLNGAPAARVLVAGASGFTGALAAQLVWRHPRFELSRRPRAATPALGSRAYPRYRVPIELTSSSSTRSTASTPRSSPTHTAPRRRPSRRCASGTSGVVDLSADFA